MKAKIITIPQFVDAIGLTSNSKRYPKKEAWRKALRLLQRLEKEYPDYQLLITTRSPGAKHHTYKVNYAQFCELIPSMDTPSKDLDSKLEIALTQLNHQKNLIMALKRDVLKLSVKVAQISQESVPKPKKPNK